MAYHRKEIPKEALMVLYLDEKKTPDEIGAIYGMVDNTVRANLRRLDIPVRSASESHYLAWCKPRKISTREQLVARNQRTLKGLPYDEYYREYFKSHRRQHAESDRRFQQHHKDREALHHREYNRRIRQEITELLGGKCSNPNCAVSGGMKDPRALQIDHVNGDGAKLRRGLNGLQSMYRQMLRDIKAGSKAYQLLCANCNWIKKFERDES
jgi:hypothetical protein